jgi:hypothetical protein
MNTTTKTTNTITRTQYLNKEATHREYYSQFVTAGVIQRVKGFKLETLIKGKDEHFNNIPLALWDSLMPVVPFEINSKLKECGDYATKAGVVCILKEAAMQIVEQN